MNGPLSVLIVDDEPLARQRLRRLLGHEADVGQVADAASGQEALTALRGDERFDLLFLDIRMPDMSGFDMLEATPVTRRPVTVFVTAHEEHAVRAFDTGAMDYLLKPFTEARFQVAMRRARAVLRQGASEWRARLQATLDSQPASRILVRRPGGTIVVRASDVDYVTAARNSVQLHTAGGIHRMRGRLSALAERLDASRFAQIHRSTLVNLDRVVAIEPLFSGDAQVLLRSGVRLRLSRTHRQEFEMRLRART